MILRINSLGEHALMKRMVFLLGLMVLGLTACTGGVYDVAYTARGDSTNYQALTQTELFQRTDDLNVVVKLGSHSDRVEVAATFYRPCDTLSEVCESDRIQEGETLRTTVGSNVGTVLLGLDYEAQPEVEEWDTGSWRVEIEVDNEVVEELSFRIN